MTGIFGPTSEMIAWSALLEAELQATTIALHPLFTKCLAILVEYLCINSGDFSPYGRWAVSPKYKIVSSGRRS